MPRSLRLLILLPLVLGALFLPHALRSHAQSQPPPSVPISTKPRPAGSHNKIVPRQLSAIAQTSPVKLLFVRDSALWSLMVNGKQQKLLPKTDIVSWQPGGHRFAYLHDGTVFVTAYDDWQHATAVWRLPRYNRNEYQNEEYYRDHPPADLSWHPSGRILTVATTTTLKVQSPDLGNTSLDLGMLWNLEISKSPHFVQYAQHWLSPVSSRLDRVGAECISYPSWSHHPNHMAFARAGDFWFADVRSINREDGWDWTEERIASVDEEAGGSEESDMPGCGQIAWRPDDKEIAYEQRPYDAGGVYLVRFWSSNLARKPRAEIPDARHPCYTSDGRSLLYDDGQDIHILNLKSGSQRILVHNATNPECRPDISVWR